MTAKEQVNEQFLALAAESGRLRLSNARRKLRQMVCPSRTHRMHVVCSAGCASGELGRGQSGVLSAPWTMFCPRVMAALKGVERSGCSTAAWVQAVHLLQRTAPSIAVRVGLGLCNRDFLPGCQARPHMVTFKHAGATFSQNANPPPFRNID